MGKDFIDPRIYDLFDDYCHSKMNRRDFLNRASVIAVTGGSAVMMAAALLPRYGEAHNVSFTDRRIKARYVEYGSMGGTSGKMQGYLVRPSGEGPFPTILVVHGR